MKRIRLTYNKPFVVGGENDHEQQISNHWNVARYWVERAVEELDDLYWDKRKISGMEYNDLFHAIVNIDYALFNQGAELTRKEEYSFEAEK